MIVKRLDNLIGIDLGSSNQSWPSNIEEKDYEN